MQGYINSCNNPTKLNIFTFAISDSFTQTIHEPESGPRLFRRQIF